ncbi:hypothetical protein [Nonomuraea sp. NPDC049129]|uniref:hypothetical protein n=1 Tax=unclassified Nonomuraea TaxID=2593643 RepID=UPI0033FFF8C0
MSPSLAAELGVRRLLIAAGQAPSVHNTQPWRFAVSGEEISLPRRSPLPAIDRSIIRLAYGPYGARPPRRPAGELETHHA